MGINNTEPEDMDIERFAVNAGALAPSTIPPLPATVELTGFSDRRHYLEQLTLLGQGRRHQSNDAPWESPLDSLH